ncbi:MAG: hypothetical protein GY820_46720, partial [Gammaproteobacteria bacterium]|nr:hypothetical protein [Gammaproteobacteria bacterium]
QAMWLYLLAEVAYHPGVLHRLFDAVDRTTPLNQAPIIYGELQDDAGFGCLLKRAVDPIFQVIAQFEKRLWKEVTSPYLEGDKLFKARLHQLLPGMYEYLSPFFMELKAYILYKLLTDANANPTLNVFSRMLWHHTHNDKGIEPFLTMFHSYIGVHLRSYSRKLTRCHAHEIKLLFNQVLVEVLGPEILGDLYNLIYHGTGGWFVPFSVAKRADKQRDYNAKMPEVWLHHILNADDPHGDRYDFASMSLFLPIIAGVRELLCINALNRVDKAEWDKKEYQDFNNGLPVTIHYGKPKYKKDDQTQEEFDENRSKRRGRWNPPSFLKGRGYASTSDRCLQITNLEAYTMFVWEGQRRDETVEQFKQRMFFL